MAGSTPNPFQATNRLQKDFSFNFSASASAPQQRRPQSSDDAYVMVSNSGSRDTSETASTDARDQQYEQYLSLLDVGSHGSHDAVVTHDQEKHELMNTPLFSWDVLRYTDKKYRSTGAVSRFGSTTANAEIFPQYALLGYIKQQEDPAQEATEKTRPELVFLNTNCPWSAFICGSQGSGKSHTLSCMLEGYILQGSRLGPPPNPMGGIVFHYDRPADESSICEAAFLCSAGIKVNVLVPKNRLHSRKKAYAKIPGWKEYGNVKPLLFRESDINGERLKSLMAFNAKDGRVPLYMEVIYRILREMDAETEEWLALTDPDKHPMFCTSKYGSQRPEGFTYQGLERKLNAEDFSSDQRKMLNLRMDILRSVLDLEKQNIEHIFQANAGTLTIVDLTDPYIDQSSACGLFDICLAVFVERSSNRGRVIALDEAHMYMTDTAASEGFTQNLVSMVARERHKGTRVLVATQEPSVNTQLIDLCKVTIVHSFSSAKWNATLKAHLAGIALADKEHLSESNMDIFARIVKLGVGESLVFSPKSFVRMKGEDEDTKNPEKLGIGYFCMKTRARLSNDGGKSKLASDKQ